MYYVSQGVSLDMFLQSYDTTKEKGYFPYEWFDDINKLENNELTAYKEFYSSLKGQNVLNIEYDAFISNGNLEFLLQQNSKITKLCVTYGYGKETI